MLLTKLLVALQLLHYYNASALPKGSNHLIRRMHGIENAEKVGPTREVVESSVLSEAKLGDSVKIQDDTPITTEKYDAGIPHWGPPSQGKIKLINESGLDVKKHRAILAQHLIQHGRVDLQRLRKGKNRFSHTHGGLGEEVTGEVKELAQEIEAPARDYSKDEYTKQILNRGMHKQQGPMI
ncbi:hypothetical protein PTTG_25496 [Puccinia triticina 1-1 BBBD Race 1]|uniref:Uncharacterized protein n=2 Tax=Puccinia triticina TaxID=208348 RepID=A0A180H140_PUCT1|nr:uncharacterized protein PtA15_5A587 [Puccinia triticina]OAV98767.1 hypothetical protein PTTG_25496 [Puccinia triticina 1-1 BBBD Race 1]WAQ85014.1 hypothetical protein PtA15_5A587 [Puccinia triticina]WAR58352.1 hypothetical protein PtB15_5B586 [Puccinia triticina]